MTVEKRIIPHRNKINAESKLELTAFQDEPEDFALHHLQSAHWPTLTTGGMSHFSTEGCPNVEPLPRDTMDLSQARSRAIRRLRERKNSNMKVSCEDRNTMVAPIRCMGQITRNEHVGMSNGGL